MGGFSLPTRRFGWRRRRHRHAWLGVIVVNGPSGRSAGSRVWSTSVVKTVLGTRERRAV